MESVLALLPQEREFVTEDGLAGTLTLHLDTVQVEPSGYGVNTLGNTHTTAHTEVYTDQAGLKSILIVGVVMLVLVAASMIESRKTTHHPVAEDSKTEV